MTGCTAPAGFQTGVTAPGGVTARAGAPTIREEKADADETNEAGETSLPQAKAPAAKEPAVQAGTPGTKRPVDPEALAYLTEVALSGFEFGDAPKVAYKWTRDIRVATEGSLADSDRTALKHVIADLNDLIRPRQISLVDSGSADIHIYYGKEDEFLKRLPGYTPGNRGYFEVSYGADSSLRRADILISTRVDPSARAHLIREELTQSLGLFQDSWRDPNSIFYQGWTTTHAYTALDRAIIRLLYDPRIAPGMTPAQVRAALGA